MPVFRPPLPMRVFSGLFFVVWVGVLAVAFLRDPADGGPFRYIPWAFLAVGLVLGRRAQRLAVVARGDELVVRNVYRSHRLDRGDIAGFAIGRHQRIGERTTYADLRGGGSVRLLALDPPMPFADRQRTLEPALDRLRAWHTGASSPAEPTP